MKTDTMLYYCMWVDDRAVKGQINKTVRQQVKVTFRQLQDNHATIITQLRNNSQLSIYTINSYTHICIVTAQKVISSILFI